MAWTTPKTDWTTGELVTAEELNAIGENLAVLRNLSSADYTTTENITTVGGFQDIDSSNLNLTITTTGGDVLVHFEGSVNPPNHAGHGFDIEVDGARLGGDHGMLTHANHWKGAETSIVSFTRLIRDLTAGAHIFKLQSRTAGLVIKAGAQFWVREI